MSDFKPLDTMRAIRDDRDLTSTQKHLLHVAALRAESKGADAGRVRASLELLAGDANMSPKSAGRAFQEPRVLTYFRRVERQTRQVGLWFSLTTPDTESAVTSLTPDTESAMETTTPDSLSTTPDSLSTTPDTESDHLPLPAPTSAAATPDLQQLAKAYETSTDVAAAMLAIAEASPNISNPIGWLRHTEWESNQRIKQQAIRQTSPSQLPPPPSSDLYGNFKQAESWQDDRLPSPVG